tara:strand:+ start:302 stop:907 length:606 start_codon:yes stop_codon:yes gene_type:complete
MYRKLFKRLIDLLVALSLLILLSPLILIITVVLLFTNEGKPFFYQDRPGYKERKIRIMKFKSMTDKKDAEGKLLPDNERITAMGKFIRLSSLDELPQLVNVLKGDMSLIGPRPLLFKYLPLYSEEQRRRHEVKPGITGLAQVNGRNAISWKKKFEYDVYYVDHLSLALDIQILFKTIRKIVIREGVNQSDDRPMRPFDGTN